MASKAEHCRECMEKLGNPYEEVHAWLDGLASPKRGYLNINHRRYRHHLEALEEVRKLFGEDAVKAAEMHIITDFGRIPTRQEVEEAFPDEWDLISFKALNKK